jgi:hypothetical protein
MANPSTMADFADRVKRFGEYPIDGLDNPPEALDPHLQRLAKTAASDAQAA